MTCSLKLVAITSHLWKGNLVALCNVFFLLQLNFYRVKVLKQPQQCVVLTWHFASSKLCSKIWTERSTPPGWEVGECHYNFTEKETAPERLKRLFLVTQQVSGGAGVTAREAPGSCYTTMLWRKVISQNSTEGSRLLLIIGRQRALDVLIGHCMMSLMIHN